MELRRVRVSDTVTRYRVTAHLAPRSELSLVRPEDGLIITGWCSRAEPVLIAGEWVSPFSNLIAVVRGEEHEAPTPAVDAGSAATEQQADGPPLVA